jgi:ABC-type branched-subunit amino acid transport system substrate-binding protein
MDEARAIFSTVDTPGSRPFRLAAVVPPERAGREIEQDLRRAAPEGGCILLPAVHRPAQAHLQSDGVTQVLETNPHGVLLWLAPCQAGELARALRQRGFNGRLAGPSRLNSPAFLERAGAAAEGVLVAILDGDQSGPVATEFNAAYRERFDRVPDASARAAHDAALVLIHALRSGPAIAAFRALPPLPGVTGMLRFDAEGNRLVTLRAHICEQGVFRPLEPAPMSR